MVARVEPVGAPLPGIADQIIESETVCSEAVDRRCTLEAVFAAVVTREFTLPDVAAMLTVDDECVAPGKVLLGQATTRREFPFGFRREAAVGPRAICKSVAI